MKNQKRNARFSDLGIAPRLLEAIDRLKFTEPTPIQRGSIPVAISGKDLIGIAQTGTGKTLAFGIPMLQRLEQVKGRGLIVLPTRELALQVDGGDSLDRPKFRFKDGRTHRRSIIHDAKTGLEPQSQDHRCYSGAFDRSS